MTFHDDMMDRAARITELAQSDFHGLMYIHAFGTPWTSAFAEFTGADPDAAGHLADLVGNARVAHTANDTGTINDVTDAVSSWTGTAADNFDSYVFEVADALELQQDALSTLGKLADAHRVVVEKARDDLAAIADQTIAALEGIDDSTDWVPIVLAVVGAAGVILSGGTSSPVLIGLVLEATAGVASAAYSSAAVGGANGLEILGSTMTAVDRLRDGVAQEELRVQVGLGTLVGVLRGSVNLDLNGDGAGESLRLEIRPPAPRIAAYPMSPVPTTNEKSWDLDDFTLPAAS